MYKNTKHKIKITALSSEGCGIGHLDDGYTVFVPSSVIGDIAEILIVKEKKTYGFGKLLEIISPSSSRVTPPCDVFGKCGGCDLQSISYEAQVDFKRQKVYDALTRIGGFSDIEVNFVPSPEKLRYRNKAQYPVGLGKNGGAAIGFYAPRSHRIVESEVCVLQDKRSEDIAKFICGTANEMHIEPYDEQSKKGILRKICTRLSENACSVVIVCAKPIPRAKELAEKITRQFPFVSSVVENINSVDTNAIYGKSDRLIFGTPYITETIGDLKYKVHYRSFFQVNPRTTELLYEKVRSLANAQSAETVFDLYCGAGTISLFVARSVKKVIGIEIVPEAVENAKENALLNGIQNAEFFCGDVPILAPRLIKNGVKADCVILDPPRKGCEESLIDTIGKMLPESVIYVSCDCATLARDAKRLSEYGYRISEVTAFDQFPQTCHVETVVLMSRVSK